MRNIEEFVDARHKSWCIHCGRSLSGLEADEDHVPSKSLLQKPRPHHLPIVTICKECNTGFSLDEQYTVTFLSCVLAGSTDPEKQRNASAARALADSPALRALIERSRSEYETLGGETRVLWRPDLVRIERVVLKNARGHAYFEYGEPMLERPAHIWILALESMTVMERQEFEGSCGERGLAPWPEVGSRMINRLLTGEDMAGRWIIVQQGVYRYSVQDACCLRVRTILSEYLATEVQWCN